MDYKLIAEVWVEQGFNKRPFEYVPPLNLIAKVIPFFQDTRGDIHYGFISYNDCRLALWWTRDDITWSKVRLHGPFQPFVLDILLGQQRCLEVALDSFQQLEDSHRTVMDAKDLTQDRKLIFINRSRGDEKRGFSCKNLDYSFIKATIIKSGVTVSPLQNGTPWFSQH